VRVKYGYSAGLLATPASGVEHNVLDKPFTPDQLLAAVAELLAGS
jgi:hypothetical protein